MSVLAALGLLAAGASLPVLGVADVDARIEQLNGRTVQVQGWLGDCAGLNCMVFADKASEAAFLQAVYRRASQPRPVMPPYLSIGGEDRTFDQRAGALQHRYVTITARVSSECRLPHGICTDRAPDLHPISIAPWRAPGK